MANPKTATTPMPAFPVWSRLEDLISDLKTTADGLGAVNDLMLALCGQDSTLSLRDVSANNLNALLSMIEGRARKDIESFIALVDELRPAVAVGG